MLRLLLSTLFLLSIFSLNAMDTEMDENGIIKGIVTTADKFPAASVTVQVEGVKKTTTTLDDGTFVLRGLKPGNYTLEITLVGYEPVTKQVSVEANKVKDIEIQLSLSDKQLKEVVVTGIKNKYVMRSSDYVAKMPLKNVENPQVYTTISKSIMQQQLAFTADDALKNATGIYKVWDAIGKAGSGGTFFTSRGFTVQPKLRNGMAGNITNTIDGANIERIEAIKGPSATLFGSSFGSYGGLINRVTKRPYEDFGGELSYAGGSFGFNRLTADVNAPLNNDKSVLFRLNTAYNSQNSFQDYGFQKSIFVAPALSYKISDRLSFDFEAEYYASQNAGMNQVFYFYPMADIVRLLGADRADKLPVDYKRSYISNDMTQKGSNANFFARMNYKISNTWNSQTYVSYTNSSSDGMGAYFYLLPDTLVTGSAVPGNHYMSRMVWTPDGSDNAVEIQQNFINDGHIGSLRNRFVGGLDYYNYNSEITYHRFVGNMKGMQEPDFFDIVATSGDVPNYANFNKSKIDSAYQNSPAAPYISNTKYSTYSAYVSDVLNITPSLMVMAALRLDYYDNKGSYDPSTAKYYGAYTQAVLSPKFGVVYQLLKDQVSVFGNYQNGFQNMNGTDYEGKTFKPEEANQWEAGVKVNAWDERISGTLSYYDIKVKNMVRTYTPNPMYSIQDGTQQSKGLEAEINITPVTGLHIMAGYAYNDSKMLESNDDVKGRRPVASGPQNMANWWLSYSFQDKLKGLGIGIGGNYAGDCYAINDATQGQFILPAYTLWNASVYYEQDKFRISAKVNNLADKHYWIGWTTVNPQTPRQFIGSIAFKF